MYLDHNATTPPAPAVVDAMREALALHWGNPSSVHRIGQDARARVELARSEVAALIGARARDVVFTSSGTEAIDLAVRGRLGAGGAARSERAAVVTTRVEHAAVRELALALEKRGEAEVRWAPVDRAGVVDVGGLERLLDARVRVVSVQWANNETGVIQPVAEIAKACRARGVTFHCDATQWVGKMPTRVWDGTGEAGSDEGVFAGDLLSFAPHKYAGPKGVGMLWIRPGTRLAPMIHGTQELERRGGTENVPGIVGAGVASRLARAWLESDADGSGRAALAHLRDDFEASVTRLVPDAVVNARDASLGRLWNTTNIAFPRLEAEAVLLVLSESGVCASAGAACSSGSLEPSPVLLSMGVPEALAHGSVRFSTSTQTGADELARAAEIIAACVSRLRGSLTG